MPFSPATGTLPSVGRGRVRPDDCPAEARNASRSASVASLSWHSISASRSRARCSTPEPAGAVARQRRIMSAAERSCTVLLASWRILSAAA
eukprot:scaffold157101_cov31-Tisochrysis_lutea.AAC.4